MDGGNLFASGSTVTGGMGGHEPCFSPPIGPGGNALSLSGGAVVRALGSVFQGGPGGYAECWEYTGPEGQVGGPVTTIPGAARHLDFSSPVVERTASMVTFGGEPGDAVALLLTAGQQAVLKPRLHGTLALTHPITAMPVGRVPAWGALSRVVRVPRGVVGPGRALVAYAQAGVVDAVLRPYLSAPMAMVIGSSEPKSSA